MQIGSFTTRSSSSNLRAGWATLHKGRFKGLRTLKGHKLIYQNNNIKHVNINKH